MKFDWVPSTYSCSAASEVWSCSPSRDFCRAVFFKEGQGGKGGTVDPGVIIFVFTTTASTRRQIRATIS